MKVLKKFQLNIQDNHMLQEDRIESFLHYKTYFSPYTKR